MKKTVSVNIGGWVFNIEEDAYERLSVYLGKIRTQLAGEPEVEEIMLDIEARIAELLQGQSKGIISIKHVEAVIGVMGNPEDFEQETDSGAEQQSEKTTGKTEKRYYRLKEDAVFGGVCSGLGAYFGVDPVLFRILFILLTVAGGSGILIYIVMLIIAPEANSTAEKLQLRGEAATVENIRQYAEKIKTEVKNKKYRDNLNKALHKSEKSLTGFVRLFSRIIGGLFLAIGMGIIIFLSLLLFDGSGIFSLFGAKSIVEAWELSELLFTGDVIRTLVYSGLSLLVFIPLLGIVSAGIRLLFDIRPRMRVLSHFFFSLWLMGLVFCLVSGIQTGLQFKDSGQALYEVELPQKETDTLYLNVQEDTVFSNHIRYHHDIGGELIKKDGNRIFYGYPRLVVKENATDSTFQVLVSKHSRGVTQSKAIQLAENIDYKVTADGKTLWLTPYFSTATADKFRGQEVVVIVKVPKGKTLFLGENAARIMRNKYSHHELFTGVYWEVKETEEFDAMEVPAGKELKKLESY